MAPLTSFVGKANIFGLRFLLRSADHLHRILDGAIGDDVLQSLEPHGFVGLAFFEAGARSVYTVRRPVRSIDDIKGLRIPSPTIAREITRSMWSMSPLRSKARP